jgi:phosphoglycolate phosphatase-like HAD superfamily hydrolase
VPTRLVLFDLDGTVLTFEGAPPGPGRTALERAMRELYALEGATSGLRVAGGTDRALARALLLRVGVGDDERAIDRLLDSYLAHLRAVLETRRYRQVGDVSRTVSVLRERGAVVGVATGNVKSGAQLKLASADLLSTFHLAHGGFGCDAEPRRDIVRVAIERCARGREAQVVVIGDTEHDVRAGRAVGARVIGVATDALARVELEAAGADAIVESCDDALVWEALR